MIIPSILLSCTLSVWQTDETAGIDHVLAARFFAEAASIAEADGGRLWGQSLAGPLMFADRCTRQIVTNHADAEERLQPKGDLFVGLLPPAHNIANTATHWAGVEWTMVAWPLPSDPLARRSLLAHEMFHRIQDEIGFPAANPSNAHLEGRDGRLWLRLEWRALASALRASGDARVLAALDAVTFRRERHLRITTAADQERALEMNEGLAEYTGRALSGMSRDRVAGDLANALEHLPESSGTLMRSFAYTSGPAYGWLLDDLSPEWRSRLSLRTSLADQLAHALGIESAPLPDGALWERAVEYDGERVRREEEERQARQEARTASLVARYVTGPVLELPLTDVMRYSFNPNNLEALGEHGTFYPTVEVSDAWGLLTVDGGALMTRDPRTMHVSVPTTISDRVIAGEGWKLTLGSGWQLRADERGSFRIEAR